MRETLPFFPTAFFPSAVISAALLSYLPFFRLPFFPGLQLLNVHTATALLLIL
jgi:hypothetical protein